MIPHILSVLWILLFSCSRIHANTCAAEDIVTSFNITNHGVVETVFIAQNGGDNGLVTVNGDAITVKYGARAVMMASCNNFEPDTFKFFHLLDKTLTFDADMTNISCGCNAAVYMNEMPPRDVNGSYDPSNCNDYYCDANAICGTLCPEHDIVEANEYGFASASHQCDRESEGYYSACDAHGCSKNIIRSDPNGYGPGASYTINTLLPFNVAISFDGFGSGTLQQIRTVLTQGSGSYTILHNDDACSAGEMASINTALQNGMVLVMSLWGGNGADMSWLDSPPCSSSKNCSDTSTATYSNFRVFDIAPTSSPTPAPTPLPSNAPTSMPSSVPTSMPSSLPTGVPTGLPTSIPTGVPTSAPTVMPTYEHIAKTKLTFHFNIVLSGLSDASTLISGFWNAVLAKTIAQQMTGVRPMDVTIADVTSPQHRRLTEDATIFFDVSVIIEALGFSSTVAAYTALTQELIDNINSGKFLADLIANAAPNSLFDSTTVVIDVDEEYEEEVMATNFPTQAPTLPVKTSSNDEAALSTVSLSLVIVGGALLLMLVVYCICTSTTSDEENRKSVANFYTNPMIGNSLLDRCRRIGILRASSLQDSGKRPLEYLEQPQEDSADVKEVELIERADGSLVAITEDVEEF